MDIQEKRERAVDEELIRKTITTEEVESILAKKLDHEAKSNMLSQSPEQNSPQSTSQNPSQTIPIQNSHGKPVVLSVGREKMLDESICPDCKGRGIIIEEEGLAHTCWRCLNEGRLDVHTRNIPVSKIRL